MRTLPRAPLAIALALAGITACKSSVGPPALHRASDPACTPGTPLASVTGGACTTVADCAPGTNVSCLFYPEANASFCNYDACDVDTDCADGGVCVCASAIQDSTADARNLCAIGGNCRVDTDCNPVHYCSPSSTGCGAAVDWYCHTTQDACSSDTDCADYETCEYAPATGRWSCVSFAACPG